MCTTNQSSVWHKGEFSGGLMAEVIIGWYRRLLICYISLNFQTRNTSRTPPTPVATHHLINRP